MREKKLSIDKIAKELDKKGFIVLSPICMSCMMETEYQLINIYSSILFKIEQVDEELYSLTIIL